MNVFFLVLFIINVSFLCISFIIFLCHIWIDVPTYLIKLMFTMLSTCLVCASVGFSLKVGGF